MPLHILGMSAGGTGVSLSVFTAIVWGISPVFMASVGRRIGSQNTNFLAPSWRRWRWRWWSFRSIA